MMNNFIEQTIDLLKRSDIYVRQTEIRPVEFKFEEGKNSPSLHLSCSDSYGGAKLSNNLILQTMMMFTVLDAAIDIRYPHLQGESYRKKYQRLPNSTDDEIILKGIFRVFKLFRNASVHSMSSINYDSDKMSVSYTYRQTSYNLEISKYGFELLFTYILDILDPLDKFTSHHHTSLNRKIYDEIKREIITFNDEFGAGLLDISNQIRLKRVVRYYIENPKYLKVDGNIQITSIYKLQPMIEDHYGVDYFIELDSLQYLIPAEVLNNNQISTDEMQQWIIK
ncbi:hypothetical protein QL993_25985 [Bacillus wiedmannii]|uniref:hypothetical protein n=1 Tax=Bacillus wiedmannii TaxID=1890302 RepID=UPI000BF937D0|nr:hypothetical protein [Bacillus wiedmannii]MDI6508176.1 hypothetical protein [Bacillus wiedmannii]MDI6513949.1 hypothetical protein [Bacillus wiedmannii]PGC10521.1 hypothetical protein COM08_30420 [Bacillus wiedmannii]HDR7963243.1 hypothetical protein [Bacillus wiedmannii]